MPIKKRPEVPSIAPMPLPPSAPPALPDVDEAAAAQFMAAAPDTGTRKEPGKDMAGQARERISLTIDPTLLRRVDQRAKARGMSRAAAIADALSDWLAEDERRRG